jgi:hypothetical protein
MYEALSRQRNAYIYIFRIVASLVRARPAEFFWNIVRWLLVAVPATWTNSWLSYVQNKLAIAYRTRLTKEVIKQYLGEEHEQGPDGKIYYKLCACTSRPLLSLANLVFQLILMTESRIQTSTLVFSPILTVLT